MNMIILSRILTAAMCVVGVTVAITTIRHGDVFLGLMVLLGQVQGVMSGHMHDESAHVLVHQKPGGEH